LPRLSIGILVIALSLAYLGTMSEVGGGRPVAPLDDSYIFYQYARQIARGHPWQYNDGDPPSTGMTSLLYPWLLAGLYRLGFQGERLVLVAVASGLLWLAGIAFWTRRLWDVLAPPLRHSRCWGTLAALTVLATGLVQWGAFLGMETGLFTLLLLAALDALLRRQAKRAVLWLGLMGLTRPEGLILALLAWGIGLVGHQGREATGQQGNEAIGPQDDGATRQRVQGRWQGIQALARRPSRPNLLLAVGLGLTPLLVNEVLTGTFSSTGLQAKSWFYNVPFVWPEILRSILLSYRRIFLRVLNGWGPPGRATSISLVAPGLTLLAGLGWGALVLHRRRLPLLLTAAWFWLGTLSTATLITATWHLGRYQAPFIPLAVVLALVGIAVLAEQSGRWRGGRRVLAGLLLLWLLVGSLRSTHAALTAFRRAVQTTARQQLALADWIREHLPPEARVGVHDTGSLRYLGERPTYDLVGLTTAETTRAWRHGAGSLFEQMERSSDRPDYFAIYPDVFSIPYLAATDLFAQELFRVEVPDYAVASAGPVQGVWRADWRLAGSGDRFYQSDILARTRGLRLVDRLDVADLADEAAHRLRWWHTVRRPGFPTEVYQMRYRTDPGVEVLDGGRLVTGGMAFQVQTQSREPLWIVARLHAREAGAVRVVVNGQEVGWWAYPPLPGEWLESLFVVPAEVVTGRRTEVRLIVDADNPDFRHYAPYHFWFLQGEPRQEPLSIARPLDVAFRSPAGGGEGMPDLRLLGFDLARSTLHPGEALSLTLYWQATAPVTSTAKVFIHLYDAQGRLGPQTDGWAVFGTRPPYTWAVGEVIADRRRVTLPPDLPPGRYSLEVGLYDERGRLPALSKTLGPFFEERVPLAQIQVRAP